MGLTILLLITSQDAVSGTEAPFYTRMFTMPSFLNDLLKSRRFWVSVGSLVAIAFKDKLPFSEEQLINAAVIVGAWIVGESLRSSSLKVEAKDV
ncbi:MAG: hypothetical protein EBR82_61280 [Caulobacteraceae bacterium]|nr:hypothetical protein [Caulobacteraceae bacterium]